MRPSPIPREAGTCAARDVVGGSGHATVVRPAGDGARVTKEDRVYLGRVVYRARGIPEPGAGDVPLRPGDRRVRARAGGTALAVSFGGAFPPGSFLRSGGLTARADACGHAEPDTARARPASYVPAGLANRHAGDWRRPPTRGSPAPGPEWPPRRSASMWNTLMTLT